MKLIIYMSHHGTTRKVVEQMSAQLRPVTVVDLEHDEAPDLSAFDTVLIGGSIHIGQLQRKLKAYCESHLQALTKKNVGLFLCFMNTREAQREFDNAFAAELRQAAFVTGLFGGELLQDKMNFMENFLTRQVNGATGVLSTLDQKAIDKFIAAVKDRTQAG